MIRSGANRTDQGRFTIRMAAVAISFLAALLVTVGLAHAHVASSQTAPHDFSCTEVTQIPLADCQALVAFYNSTNGAQWGGYWGGWLQTNTPCTWGGVTCVNGRVGLLRLGGTRDIQGILPSELGDLTGLYVLELDGTGLTGNIPATLGNLTNLNRLSLYNSHLSGPIPPELGKLSNLQLLQLSENELSGPIPPTLGNLPLLENLAIELCALSGEIPPELGNLHNLRSLLLYRNQLQGAIPATFGNLTNLEYLSLNSNHLSGPIPPELGKLTKVHDLILYSNHLSGSIPPELGNMSRLSGLELSDNQLSGEIPAELMQPPYLSWVGVDYNMVTPTDPTVIAWLNIVDPGWEYTQTVPPSHVQATLVASRSVTLTWTPIPHLWWEEGFYEVSYATRSGGPYVVHGTTPDRATDHYAADDLPPANLYCFVVRTFTARPIYYFANEWWSAYSPEVCVGAPTAVRVRRFSATATFWGRPLCTIAPWFAACP